ncbi:hypothetical protein IWZ00DRAFT_487673 [Phyllosticta capitalensis]|uniref:uncharacterized protein n=1 Tax=Phyllosticta capitalensis TaxID=121624 RepID=UPI00313071B3
MPTPSTSTSPPPPPPPPSPPSPPPHPPTPLGTLGLLPAELLLLILSRLSYPSALQLAATNQQYRSAIDPPRYISDSAKACFLRYAEVYLAPDPDAVGACLKCWRVVPVARLKRGAHVPLARRVRRALRVEGGDGEDREDGGNAYKAIEPRCTSCPALTSSDLRAYRLHMDDMWDAPIAKCALCTNLRVPPTHFACARCGDCACLAAEREGKPYFVEEESSWCYRCGEERFFGGRPRMEGLVSIGWEEFESMWARMGDVGF